MKAIPLVPGDGGKRHETNGRDLAATRNIAAAYHKLDQIGTLEKGKLADLVVLDADPLQDINNIREISLVIKDGHVIDRDKLPLKQLLSLPRTAARPSSQD